MEGMAIFSGNSNPGLVQKICNYLSLPLGGAQVKTFSDGEIQIEIHENVRLKDVFVVQSTCSPVNDNLVELLLMIDAFNRSSAKKITAVIPYFGYGRQDKKVAPRVPISAKLVADMITTAGDLNSRKKWPYLPFMPPSLFLTIRFRRRRIEYSVYNFNWLGREDSNLRMQEPKSCVLPLDDAPPATGTIARKYKQLLGAFFKLKGQSYIFHE